MDDHETMSPEEANNEGFMRTKSTQSMEDKSAKEKWQVRKHCIHTFEYIERQKKKKKGLFRMYKEYKYQKAVNEASSYVRKQSDKDSTQDEIIKLRATIYAMKQRKDLTATDEKLLKEMNEKLSRLTRKSQEL